MFLINPIRKRNRTEIIFKITGGNKLFKVLKQKKKKQTNNKYCFYLNFNLFLTHIKYLWIRESAILPTVFINQIYDPFGY